MWESTIKKHIEKLISHQAVRYLLVGGWNTSLGYALFASFYFLGSHCGFSHIVASESALVGANVISVLQAYFLYKHIVFKSPHSSWMEFFRFSSVYAVQLTGNLIVLPLLVSLTHLQPLLAQAIVIPMFVLLTYLAHHHVSFKHKKAEH